MIMYSAMSICLNMIVKNESHIIEETLTNLLKKIKFDYWVICDTGSTDTTKELIQKFFDSRGISGELIDSEWKNFSHNRTVAFQNAYKKTDYVFVWDADDEIEGDFKLPEHLTADWYNFTFANDFGVNYSRPQLFKNTLRWKYISVLHEYAVCEEHAEPAIHVQGNYHFISGRRGARSKDPNKYLNDALLLEKAYYEALETKDSLYNRYAFYCAGSYRDCGNKEKALEFYKKVLTHDNWSEEKYVSCRNIYELYRDLGKEVEGLGYLVKSREYSARRVECVYQLVLYYCLRGQNDTAYMYYTLIQHYYENEYMPSHMNGFLFANKKEFELLLPYYMIIVAQRTGHYETGMKMCELICRFQYPDVNEFYVGNWIHNMQFFMDYLPKNPDFFKNFREYLNMIKSKGISVKNVQNVIDRILNNEPITYETSTCITKISIMQFYDFIEIGTSDFDTEIEKKDEKIGISIEPIKYYLDRIPNKQNCIKLNLGISNYNGTCIVNYLSEQTIQKYNFPVWLRGCNSINSYHKTVYNICKNINIDIEKISEKDSVDVTTLYTLMNKLSIAGVYYLKIDTEGHDTVILKKFYEENKNNMYLPHLIQFESNELTNREDTNHIISLFTNVGYDLIKEGHDTMLKLNLKKIKNKMEYTPAIKNYYIMDYPLNYSLSKLPHENTLESAKEYCKNHNCSGITLQDGIYQVRNGNHINYFKGDVYSWIFI